MQKALVDAGGTVVNIIEWSDDSEFTPPDGQTLVDVGDGCAIGGTYSGGAFHPPAPPTPVASPPTAEQFAALQQAVVTLTLHSLPIGG